MKSIDFPFQLVDKIMFSSRPQPLPASLRPVYRILLIALVLKINCRGNTASLLKLQFFNWVLKSSSLQEFIEERLTHNSVFTLELIHIDPMVNLALKYAFADNFISVTRNSKYKLTMKGAAFVDLVMKDKKGILSEELELLKRIGQRVSEVCLRNELL